jgi:hypothetical protein
MTDKARSHRASSWVPVLGEFDHDDSALRFKGKLYNPGPEAGQTDAEVKERPTAGLALSNLALADGILTAEIEFERVTDNTACELVLSYDANATHILTAGLGGSWSLYGIREYGGRRAAQWFDHQARGDRANLKAGRPYSLRAEYRGDNVSLMLDDVPVAAAQVPSAGGAPRQAGIFCRGDHVITVKGFQAVLDKPRAFAVMQFSAEFDDVYRDVVREVCVGYELDVLRADEVNGPGLVIGDIIRHIGASQLVIADITPSNPNVYFEVGYALALNKPTILLARKGTPLPFDVAGFRVLFYEDSIGGKKKLEEGLRTHLGSILGK